VTPDVSVNGRNVSGAHDAIPDDYVQIQANAGGFAMNLNNYSIGGAIPSTAKHMIGVVSGTNTGATYYDGGNKSSGASGASQGVPTFALYVDARNGAGVPDAGTYSTNQVAAIHGGGALTDTDVANLYSRLRTHMTAVGVP